MPYLWLLIGPMLNFKCQSSKRLQISSIRTTSFQKWKTKTKKPPKKQQHKKTCNIYNRLCLIHDNAGANRCLVQDFLKAETVVQLPNSPYSPDSSSCDFFCLLHWNPISPDVDMSLKVFCTVSFSVSTGWAQQSLLICIQSLDFKTRNWISVKGEHLDRLKYG